MKPTLLILAAGMASRYGSMKQTASFGPSGETIMDYSIYDAIRAGFGKVVFIIRKDFSADFEPMIGEKLHGKIEFDFVYQELDSHVQAPERFSERVKPWGTGHAILCAQEKVKEPFAVINADDFYGAASFRQAADFLMNQCNENTYAIIGYQLDKTLSEHGTVSRGVCQVDEMGNLLTINERTKIFKKENQVLFEENETLHEVYGLTSVSMNFWCFYHDIFSRALPLFNEFVEKSIDNLKSEFFIPIVAEAFIADHQNSIKVIPTDSEWFGVTYKEDADGVRTRIAQLTKTGDYPESLWK